MAMDVARQVVLDPLLADKFSIIRRIERIDDHGRSQKETQNINRITGVVTMFSDREVIRERFPEMGYADNVISVISIKKLQTAVVAQPPNQNGYQPDLVLWRGNHYLVQKVSPYPQYGKGFYEAVCSSIDLMDVP